MSYTNDISPGYLLRPIPKSVKEAISHLSEDRIKTVTKSSIEGYIRSFMDTEGANRVIMEQTAAASLQYITDFSFDPSEDPTKRKTQLARLFEQVQERLPCILIVDAGLIYKSAGLGSKSAVSGFFNKHQTTYDIIRQVPVLIIAASEDPETTDILVSMLSLIFGEYRDMSGSNELFPDNDTDRWVVRLPLTFDMGALEKSAIGSDPKDQIWTNNLNLTVTYEDKMVINRDRLYAVIDHSASLPTGIPIINFPDTVQLNSRTSVSFDKYLPIEQKVVISDYRIATIDSSFFVVARSLGQFKIQVINLHEVNTSDRTLPPKILAEKQVTVTLY